MIYFIKLLVFGVSNLGFWELIRRNSKIDKYFLPSLTIAIQVTVLFVAGLFNLLEEVTYLLYGVGLCGFVYWLYKDRNLIKNYFDAGFVFLGIMLVIMLFFVKDRVFTHYDNFSHWALVVRRMLQVNRYPNFEDTIIIFQEYPLGSATYIYYFAKLTSRSESAQMLAQIYMMLASIVPLFSFCKKNKLMTAIAIMSATNFFFTYNISVTDLLVDTLLPLVAMCGLLYVWRYGTGVNGKIEFYAVIFYLVQLVQIKNSGLFFVAIMCIWLLFNVQNDKKILRRGICISAPFVSLLLWQKHCKYVFAGAETSKHAMTVENFSSVFGAKTLEDIKAICVSMLKFAITYKEIWLTFAIVFFVGILVFIFAKDEKNIYMKIVLFSIVMYVAYQIGTLGMYLFSMPVDEALSLDGNMRYTKTILIAILYLTMISAVKLISKLEEKRVRTVFVGSIVIMSFFVHLYFSFGKIRIAIQYQEDASMRNWIEETKIAYNVPDNESYIILAMDNNSGYAYFLERYIFQSNSVGAMSVKNLSDLNDIRFKYIFVYDEENEIIKEWIQSNYPEQYGNRVIVQEEVSYE